jgi:hypothetical protein
MIWTLATHGLAFLAGCGAYAAYVHKHTAAAIAASTTLAAAVADLKAEVKKV